MKSMRLVISLLVFFFIFNQMEAQAHYRKGVSFRYFYENLHSYGEWLQMNDGLVVWRPHNHYRQNNWAPYRSGSWIWTNYGWYWDSNDDFGYIVYHYGRWYYDDYYGWIWVPDNEWAPSWVEWRYDDEYIGWAPLPPYANFSSGYGVTYSYNYVIVIEHWYFIPVNNFCMTNYDNYYLNGQYRTRAYSRTISRNVYRYRDNTVMNNGLDRDFIERRTNTRVRENNITFRETDSYTDRPSRTNNQIEFRVPRERSDQRDFSNMQINRGDRRSTLATDKVTIGERKVLEERERARQEKTRIEREKNATRETQTQNNNTRTPDVRQEPQQRNNENRDPAVLRGGNNQQGRENTQTQRTPTVQRGDNRQIENRTMGNTRTETRERQTPQSGNRERTNSNDRQTQGDRPSRTR